VHEVVLGGGGAAISPEAAQRFARLGGTVLGGLSQACLEQMQGERPAHSGAPADQALKGLRHAMDGIRQYAASLSRDERNALHAEFSAALPQVGTHLDQMKGLFEASQAQLKEREDVQALAWSGTVNELTTRMNGGQTIGNGELWTMATARASPELRRVLEADTPQQPDEFGAHLEQHIANRTLAA
jgi:hypothetical protein